MSRISPSVLLVIVILAIIFFISSLLHLLVRFLMKRPSFSSVSQSNRFPETSGSHAFQRQLQQLFRLHDSGLDQAHIDALPVFYYKDIMGSKEPFDCVVCLCEFSERDKLRLLPMCSHAFHINCIDTWLLSNSTCPLCRGTLNSSGLPMENPLFYFGESREQSIGFCSDGENEFSSGQKIEIIREHGGEKSLFSVRLGKFRSVNGGGQSGERSRGETSSCNLDARRCYSMGSFQYVVGDSDLQVALSNEGKMISGRSKGESFSVSKVWLWSKKRKFTSSLDVNVGVSSLNIGMPMTNRSHVV